MNEFLSTIKQNKLRTVLTAFGVFWGIFMIVLMLGIGNGIKNGVLRNFGGLASNSFFVWGSRTSLPWDGIKAGRSIDMRNSDIDYLRREMPELKTLVPMNQMGGYRGSNTVSRGNKSGAFEVAAAYPDIRLVQMLETTKGRFLNMGDINEKRKIAVIGEGVRVILFGEEEPLGKTVKIGDIHFTVAGVFDSNKSDDRATREINQLFIPFSTYQKAYNAGDKVGWITGIAKDGYDVQEVQDKIELLLSPRLRYDPQDKQALGGWNAKEEMDKITGLFNGITIFNWVVGLLTLMAGIVGISNIMLIVVKERTREIGVRKALGATPISIIQLILFETVILTILSGYLGIVLGVLLVENFEPILLYIANSFSMNFGLDMFYNAGIQLKTALQALGILVFFGLVAGLIPAIQAVKVKPIEALRAE